MVDVVHPYDPAESPGPIPSVVERFRPSRDRPETPWGPEAEAARFTVVLVPPDAAAELGFERGDPGLKVFIDDDWEGDVRSLDEATKMIRDEAGVVVTLVEHHADLVYWTTRPTAVLDQ